MQEGTPDIVVLVTGVSIKWCLQCTKSLFTTTALYGVFVCS